MEELFPEQSEKFNIPTYTTEHNDKPKKSFRLKKQSLHFEQKPSLETEDLIPNESEVSYEDQFNQEQIDKIKGSFVQDNSPIMLVDSAVDPMQYTTALNYSSGRQMSFEPTFAPREMHGGSSSTSIADKPDLRELLKTVQNGFNKRRLTQISKIQRLDEEMSQVLPEISFRNSGHGSSTFRKTGFISATRDYGGTPIPESQIKSILG